MEQKKLMKTYTPKNLNIQEEQGCVPWNNRLPCAKFIIAAGISVASFTIGCTMVIMSPTNSPLLPFYSSLITGAISYWVQPPSMTDKK